MAIDGDGLEAGMPVIVRGNERISAGSPVREDGTGGATARGVPAVDPGEEPKEDGP